MAKITDKARVLCGHLKVYLENCHERCIKKIERIKGLKPYSIGNHVGDESLT